MKRDFVPQRTCVACRKKQDKALLLRLTRSGGDIVIDPDGKGEGRGVYVCKNAECANALKKKKALNKAFKGAVPESVYDEVIAAVENLYKGENN